MAQQYGFAGLSSMTLQDGSFQFAHDPILWH